ncbi:MAG: single-stranded DNA-binding protein [Clostridia bacterium]|nr:single-stranded DNA-binding protein [Clostridia bacterium]
MNKVFLIGNLTADPQGSTFDSGNTNCRFSIAVNRFSRNGEGNAVDFINIVAWNQLASNCTKYLVKGSKVAVVGSIVTGSYERDGVKRTTFDIRADQVEFLSRPDGATQQGTSSSSRESIDSLQEVSGGVEDDMPF